MAVAAAPQRVNGKVTGVVNGVSIGDVDLHAYIVSQDGRVFTSISPMPAALGYAFQSLFTLSGGLEWLFAAPTSPSSKNGLMLSGINRERLS